MIEIKEKSNCCGCNACAQICPRRCISMKIDEEGFLYPLVDTSLCIDCGLCEKVCPIINQGEPQKPIAVYASKNKNEEIRLKSSSGGIFTLLADQIISEDGVVFGAKFDHNWNVIHDYTETVDGINAFRGSKYVQSVIGNNYKLAKQFLDDDRKVLFSGTPCQIAGLKKYLRKEYENLLTVEVVCHGVPSPMIWRDYLDYKRAKRAAGKNTVSSSLNELPVITGISFRDKTNGWKKYGFKISYAASKAAENSVSKLANTDKCEITPFYEDTFMKGFLKNLYLRPSCHHCVARQGKSGADISIADYWNIQHVHNGFDDDKGSGLVIINSEKGGRYYNILHDHIDSIESYYSKATLYNQCIIRSVAVPPLREEFWTLYRTSGVDAINVIYNRMRKPIIKRIISRIKTIIASKLK